jgi:hypothetical protein
LGHGAYYGAEEELEEDELEEDELEEDERRPEIR